MQKRFRLTAVLVALCALAVHAGDGDREKRESHDDGNPLVLDSHGSFDVGGQYVNTPAGQQMFRQMYVDYMIPKHLSHRYPIVMIHGGTSTGTNFESTPDGRESWADFFVREGYAVYVVDQPARARSGYNHLVDGPLGSGSSTLSIEQTFTAPELFNLWPQARLHTQWPGTGRVGDPIFDQFFAGRMHTIANAVQSELNIKSAGAALLDKIGPAIVLTHSQSGAYGWQIADARANLVKAILAVEPSGPPFFSSPALGPSTLSLPWGITLTPITYAPAVTNPAQLVKVQEAAPDGPDLLACWTQGAPVRQLPTLHGIPILMITAQASYHAQYDHCTSKYLTQAGVAHDFIRLEEVGIFGNGHMLMLEKNNLQIADVLADWLYRKHL